MSSRELYASLTDQEVTMNRGGAESILKPVWFDAGKYDHFVTVGEKPQPKPLPELDQAIGHNVLHQAPTPQIDLERSVRPSWVDRVLNMVTPSRPAPQQRYLPQPQQIQAQVQAQQMQHITTPFQTTAPNTILRPQTVRRELYNPLATPLPPVTPYTQNKLTF